MQQSASATAVDWVSVRNLGIWKTSYTFTQKHPLLSGPTHFKPVFFKGQLYLWSLSGVKRDQQGMVKCPRTNNRGKLLPHPGPRKQGEGVVFRNWRENWNCKVQPPSVRSETRSAPCPGRKWGLSDTPTSALSLGSLQVLLFVWTHSEARRMAQKIVEAAHEGQLLSTEWENIERWSGKDRE